MLWRISGKFGEKLEDTKKQKNLFQKKPGHIFLKKNLAGSEEVRKCARFFCWVCQILQGHLGVTEVYVRDILYSFGCDMIWRVMLWRVMMCRVILRGYRVSYYDDMASTGDSAQLDCRCRTSISICEWWRNKGRGTLKHAAPSTIAVERLQSRFVRIPPAVYLDYS